MRKLIFLYLIISVLSANAQESTSEEIIENFIEEVTSSTDQELDYTTMFEDLNYYLENPLNLNEASLQDLEKLYILSDYQMKGVILYRENYGSFYSVYELIHIGGFNADVVKMLLPFITVEKVEPFLKFKPSQALKYGSNQVFLRTQKTIEDSPEYSDPTPEQLAESPNSFYPGSPYKVYSKYKFSYKNLLNWGITAEKDPGEEFFKGTRKDGFDYYSAHFFARKLGPIKSLAIGDYNAQFGQGLVLFNGFGYGKSSMVLDVRKKAQGLRPYGGTDENLFFRGAGATIGYKAFDITVFYSHKKKDANITVVDSLGESIEEVSSLQTSGLHRTPSEIDDRKAITETVYGAHIQIGQKKFRIGLTGTAYNFDADIVKSPQPYNQFEFSGNSNFNAGLDYQASISDLTLFGEAAVSENGGMAFLNGALFSLSPQMSMALLHRHFEKEYQALYASSFGENSTVSNEDGLYFGTVIYPFPRLKILAYYDMYSFPWLKYGVNAPSHGHDYITQADYSLSRYVSMYIRIKREVKPENIPSTESISPITGIENVTSTKLRYNIAYKVSNSVEFRNRFEWVISERNNLRDDGFMLYHDVILKPSKIPFTFSARYAIFNTDSWETSIYAFENDILYSFSIPAYSGKGSRLYFNIKYSVTKNIDLWFRIAQTYSSDVNNLNNTGTTLNKTKTEAKVQLRFRF